jgi:hypothetical protein
MYFLYRSLFLLFSFFLSHISSSLLFCVSYKDVLTAAVMLFVFLCVRARLCVKPGRPTRWFLQKHLLVLTVRRFFAVNAMHSLFLSLLLFITTTSMKNIYFCLYKSHYFLFSLYRYDAFDRKTNIPKHHRREKKERTWS